MVMLAVSANENETSCRNEKCIRINSDLRTKTKRIVEMKKCIRINSGFVMISSNVRPKTIEITSTSTAIPKVKNVQRDERVEMSCYTFEFVFVFKH